MILVAILLASSLTLAATPQDYEVPDGERADPDAQQYGGYPNNRDFNNDTPCRVVLAFFDARSPNHQQAMAFLAYARASLMLLDRGSGREDTNAASY